MGPLFRSFGAPVACWLADLAVQVQDLLEVEIFSIVNGVLSLYSIHRSYMAKIQLKMYLSNHFKNSPILRQDAISPDHLPIHGK